jgi:uncharacterized repeat protein (TIGR03803 family)
MIGADNALYGTAYGSSNTSSGGGIFKINRDGSGYKVLHSFSTEETDDDLNLTYVYYIGLTITHEVNGLIYGTISGSGTNNGAIFRIDTDGGDYTVLHGFSSTDGLPYSVTLGNDGVLYGAGNAIFKMFIDGSGYTVLHTFVSATEGSRPVGHLIQAPDGELYGINNFNGASNYGTIFKIDSGGTNFDVIYTFTNALLGTLPTGPLLLGQDGALYGTASRGGTNGDGAVFRINTDGTGYQNLYSFGSSTTDGSVPYGGLIQDLNGVLYGTASSAVNTNIYRGTIYKINPDGSGFATLYQCSQSFGSAPVGGLVEGSFQGSTGIYYGTTSQNGIMNYDYEEGTIFALAINPPLTITPGISQNGASGPVVFWPTWALNYELQSTTNLSAPNWTTVTNGVPVFGLQMTNPSPQSFYRLVYP